MREIELYYQKNIRDLGGLVGFKKKKVKSGRIYRGGFLGHVNVEDVKIINSLHLTDIVDNYSKTNTFGVRQNAVEQRCFTASEITGD